MSFCCWQKQEIYKDHFKPGVYVCSKCGYELFSSTKKIKHDSPWPAFTEPIHEDSVSKTPQPGDPDALKLTCGKCGNPLGHEFLNDRSCPNNGSRF